MIGYALLRLVPWRLVRELDDTRTSIALATSRQLTAWTVSPEDTP